MDKNGFNQNKLFETSIWLSETIFILIEIIEILLCQLFKMTKMPKKLVDVKISN